MCINGPYNETSYLVVLVRKMFIKCWNAFDTVESKSETDLVKAVDSHRLQFLEVKLCIIRRCCFKYFSLYPCIKARLRTSLLP